MSAALSRAAQLAEENASLRDEVLRLREAVQKARERALAPAGQEDPARADDALRLLDRLAASEDEAPREVPHGVGPRSSVLPPTYASEEVLCVPEPTGPAARVAPANRAPSGPVRLRASLWMSAASFLVGLAFAGCLR